MNDELYLSEKTIALLKRTMLSGYSEDEQESFIALCQNNRLDPLTKQIYATRRWVKDRQGNKAPTLVPVISAMGLTAIAVRTGHYDGCETSWCGPDGIWKNEWISEEFPVAAKCVVYHKQRSHPEVGIAHWAGYCGQSYNKATNRWDVSEFWERLGPFMLAKCAKAQALRGAFPDLCNLYISEELQGGISEVDQYDDEAKIAQNRAREEELLKAAAAKGTAKVVENKSTKPRPTPAEAAAPAEPPKPVAAARPEPVPAPAPVPQEPPDDLDMGPQEAPQPEDVVSSAGGPVEDKAWKFHVIQGLTNPKYNGRTVGDLTVVELTAVQDQWMPKVRQVWAEGKTVKEAQEKDYKAFEAAIADSQKGKPW